MNNHLNEEGEGQWELERGGGGRISWKIKLAGLLEPQKSF